MPTFEQQGKQSIFEGEEGVLIVRDSQLESIYGYWWSTRRAGSLERALALSCLSFYFD